MDRRFKLHKRGELFVRIVHINRCRPREDGLSGGIE
jgi:hypothetical protein